MEERSHQVAFMRDIYANASRIVVILAESDLEVEKLILLYRNKELFEERQDGSDIVVDDAISGVVKLLKKPWWLRL